MEEDNNDEIIGDSDSVIGLLQNEFERMTKTRDEGTQKYDDPVYLNLNQVIEAAKKAGFLEAYNALTDAKKMSIITRLENRCAQETHLSDTEAKIPGFVHNFVAKERRSLGADKPHTSMKGDVVFLADTRRMSELKLALLEEFD